MSENSKQKEKKQELLSAYGGTIDEARFTKESGLTEKRIRELKTQRALLFFLNEGNETIYPVWQLYEGALLTGLQEVFLKLSRGSSWSKLLFFITPNDYLEGVLADKFGRNDITPIDALRDGFIREVLDAQAIDDH